MAGKNTAVFGIYRTYEAVEQGVAALQADGFRNTDISVLFPENVGTKDFAHEKHTKAPAANASWWSKTSSVSSAHAFAKSGSFLLMVAIRLDSRCMRSSLVIVL